MPVISPTGKLRLEDCSKFWAYLVSSTDLDYPRLQNEPTSKLEKKKKKRRNYMNELSGFPTVHLSYF